MVTMPAAPDWRTTYADKLMTPAEAMAIVAPGDAVWTGVLNSVPSTLCAALAARAPLLPGVVVYTALSPFKWDQPGVLEQYRVLNLFGGLRERQFKIEHLAGIDAPLANEPQQQGAARGGEAFAARHQPTDHTAADRCGHPLLRLCAGARVAQVRPDQGRAAPILARVAVAGAAALYIQSFTVGDGGSRAGTAGCLLARHPCSVLSPRALLYVAEGAIMALS